VIFSQTAAVRGFVFGMVLMVAVAAIVLSVRPGGFRRQLRLMGRRLRVVLWLGGIYVVGSIVIRLAFPNGPVSDYGPAGLALALVIAFLIFAQDPAPTRPGT
jgi:hypothetical protein